MHATNIVIAVSLAAAPSAFSDMSLTRPARWIEHDIAINQLSIDHKSSLPIGGRFICSVEQDEDRMVKALVKKGLSVADSDQCEIIAFQRVSTDVVNVRETIGYMLQIAGELDYRLISVEAGDFESGNATILASEEGYIPWWQKTAPTSN
ncbi:putative Mrr-cat superfamily restriction endonuclease [Phyllobacterium ifriqiyense]|uniref:Mrr-cat superfamily restriction endonuclease n=1 Tax=Phyllobacterium ifriqiyense TaxID=314238 RepID=A0ABU0S3L4_9HYPH|nr:hypothetical protein [Phyllobacterium ifriqiyense]MDQ0995355.1 putative Mrr-cat superfamily restriction endonuclease [Phyllobacterium ifriqiyense]